MCYIPVQVSSDPGNQYSVSLMNSLVLYVGTQAIGFIHSKGNTPSTSTIAHTAHMDIFQHLVVDLDTEGMHATLCVHNMCSLVLLGYFLGLDKNTFTPCEANPDFHARGNCFNH